MTKLTAAQILGALEDPSIPLDQAQCRKAWDALRVRFDRLTLAAAQGFRAGDKVWFDSKSTSATHRGRQEGVVERVNAKSVTVRVGPFKWKVAPSLLNKVA